MVYPRIGFSFPKERPQPWGTRSAMLPASCPAAAAWLDLKVKEMISWRLIVPAVLVAAAMAGCFTYFVTAPPPVEASPDIKGPDTRTPTFIDQRARAEDEAKAVFERAAAAILRQAPELQASVGVNEPPTAEHIPLPKKRPLPRP
jgi:hypothetical protein